MAQNKAMANTHAKRYIESVFEQRLREEGFVCPNDKFLCWYRVKNGEILNFIVFYSAWSNMPLMMDVGHGMHPLFQKPVYTPSVHFSDRPDGNDYFRRQSLVEKGPINQMGYSRYAEDIQVMAPGHDGKGIYTLNEIILPQMEDVTTIEECYRKHKQGHLDYKPDNYTLQYMEANGLTEEAMKFRGLSEVFIDEAIYLDDAEVFPYCKDSVERYISSCQECCRLRPNNKEYPKELQRWEQRRSALLDGGRSEYLTILEKRKAETIAYLKKKCGVTF